MKQVAALYANQLEIEVLSGGMIIGEAVQPIENMAHYIEGAYQNVENLSGIKFGEDYLWHIRHPDLSDWVMNSEKPAIALCIFKEYYPEKQLAFASDLQYALNFEGRDLCDDEAYRHLLEKYGINEEAFFKKLKDETYIDQAHYEFSLCKHLQVTGYPAVLLQESDSKFHLLARGYTSLDEMKERIDAALKGLS
jgi:putative protein-disulfide isomerase